MNCQANYKFHAKGTVPAKGVLCIVDDHTATVGPYADGYKAYLCADCIVKFAAKGYSVKVA